MNRIAEPDTPVLGISHNDAPAAIQVAINDWGIEYPVVVADEATLKAYEIDTFPTTVVVDGEGNVTHTHVGLLLDPQLWWITR